MGSLDKYLTQSNIEFKKMINQAEGSDEKIETVLRRKFVESISALQEAAQECYKGGNRRGAIDALTHINTIALQTRELDLYKRTTNLIGHILFGSKAYGNALIQFKKLKDAATEDFDFPMTAFALSQIGKCYQ
jgi:tetratricopeptide (TPR) repeat protein